MVVDRRAALRDLKLLAEHVDFHSTGEGRQRRWILDPALRVRNLGVMDRIALELGRETTRFLEGSGLHEGLARVAPDRLASLPAYLRRNLERKLRIQAEPHRSYANHRETVEEVLDGLLRERLHTITYQRADGTERRHEGLMPLTMVLYRRAMYLMVRRQRDGRTFSLALERIQNISIGEPFTYPHDWDPDKELSSHFGMVRSGKPERVVMRFAPQVAVFVRARTWHPSQVIRELPDGRLELEMHTAGRELLRMALEWGHLCEVIEPEALRAEVIENIRASAEMYQIDPTKP
jgi:predicted DNA-binding transcriptional regulator YafY